MAKTLDENIIKAKKDIEEDRELINDTIKVLGEFQKEIYLKRLSTDVTNPAFVKI